MLHSSVLVGMIYLNIVLLQVVQEAEEGSRHICLKSVDSMRRKIVQEASVPLRNLMRDHTFVGCIDAKHSLVQYERGLYMIDTELFSRELFYQV